MIRLTLLTGTPLLLGLPASAAFPENPIKIIVQFKASGIAGEVYLPAETRARKCRSDAHDRTGHSC